MASGVEELLDMLFEMVDEAKNMPLSSDKCVLERDRALDLIDDIRAQFPVELGEAKKLVASRNDYIAAAKREAEVIRKQAEAEAQRMLAEESVLNQAKQRSAELMRQAEERSRELKRSANEYCEDALRRTEEVWRRPMTRSRSPGPASGRRPAPPPRGARREGGLPMTRRPKRTESQRTAGAARMCGPRFVPRWVGLPGK